MKGLKRLLKAVVVLAAFGASAVTLTFLIVSQSDELGEDRYRLSSERPPPPEAFGPRYSRWVRTVIGSHLTDFGQSHTGPVKNILADRLPVTAAISFLSWVLGWGLGLALAILLGTRWRSFVQIDPRPSRFLRSIAGILSLTVLMLPGTTALWLNGIRRVLDREFVRVAKARGISPFALWKRHIMPNVIVSSGVLTQAVFSLSGLVVGSFFVEGVFRLGGVGEAFIEGATRGQAELAGFATLVYFLVTATGVLAAEGIVIYLDPDGELAGER
jgi:ABC-type dipeptide/oligopeptide/nickel transport system permease component